jgi:lipopolysaccharide export system permease protein
MKNIEIVNFVGNFEKVETVYTAKEANLQSNSVWTFTDLKEYNVSNNQTTAIDNSKLIFKVPINEILADPVKAKQLTMKELREKSVYFGRVGADTKDLLIEFYYRISFAFSAFIMSFIGLSLGSKYVRGGAALNIGLSVIIGYSYYGMSSILKAIAASGTIPIYLACWIPNILFLYIGIMLFKKAEY